jgi:hypothetical protein
LALGSWLLALGSCLRLLAQHLCSWLLLLALGSKPALGSFLALGSWLLALGSYSSGSWLLGSYLSLALGSWLFLGSWLLALGSWLLALGSWLTWSWLLALEEVYSGSALGSWLLAQALGSSWLWLLALGSWQLLQSLNS